MSVPWRQFIIVRGESLALLESVSNIAGARRDPESNTVILQGDGVRFPEMHDAHSSWAALCVPRRPEDIAASDIYPILRVLLDAAVAVFSDDPRADVAAWLRERAR